MAVSVDGISSGLSRVHDAIDSGRFNEISDICDSLELELAAKGLEKPVDWPYAIHLLGHIYVSDLNSARFLWKRIPETVKENHPEVAAVWRIGQCLWTYDYSGVHDALHINAWSPLVQRIVTAFGEDYLKKNMKLLSTAYSSLSVNDASKFLGLTEAEAVKCTTQAGWRLDPISNMLSSPSVTSLTSQKLDSSKLQNLTAYVFHLEH